MDRMVYMKKRLLKKIFAGVLCIVLALCSTVLFGCNDAQEQQTNKGELVEAVRVTKGMVAGSFISASDVETVEAYSGELPEGYLTKASDAFGKRLSVDVVEGEFLSTSMFETKSSASNTGNNTNQNISESTARELGYVVVTDYITAGKSKEVSKDIQKIIDENPNSTIYFPDGIYNISSSILTSSDPQKAVSLYMSNFAIIKATYAWKDPEQHMIRLGAKDKTFDIDTVGSNFYLYGGVIDGNNVAKGVSVEGGRETSVRYVSMKNVTQGLHIMYNEECPSSNVDVQTVNIVGAWLKDSVGVLVDGYDNTLTNMRVASFQVGIKLNGARNTLRNLHMLWRYRNANYDYEDSVGFWDTSEGNYYDICYPDNFAIGFLTEGRTVSVYNNCYAYWYSEDAGETQIGFKSTGKFNSILKHYRVDLREEKAAKFIVVGATGGNGIIEYPIFPEGHNEEVTYKDYLVGKVIWY